MKDLKVIVLAELTVNPIFLEEVKIAARKSVDAAIKEPGVELFMLTSQPEKPNCLVFFEVYKSKEAHESHLQTEHARQFFLTSQGKMLKPSKLTFLSEF